MKVNRKRMIQSRSSRFSSRPWASSPRQNLFIPILASVAILILPAVSENAPAQVTILHSFGDGSVHNDGANPPAGLIQAPNGDFFGVTVSQARTPKTDAGTVFRMTPAGKITIIKAFGAKSNKWPSTPLTYYNGRLVGIVSGSAVFALTPSGRNWQFRIWHTFAGGSNDGLEPVGGLTLGPGGALYGVTLAGGTDNVGTAYKIDPTTKPSFSILYRFTTNNYWSPGAALALANDGNFYGTTMQAALVGSVGSTFRLTPQGQFTVIWSLFPPTQAPLIQASNGNLYGTIPIFEQFFGNVFSLGTSCCFFIIHSFIYLDGENPDGALVQGPNGNLYGMTRSGGSAGSGTIFEISTDGLFFQTLHNFRDGSVPNDGASPNGGLIVGQDGNLYGTTAAGGSAGLGTIFKISP